MIYSSRKRSRNVAQQLGWAAAASRDLLVPTSRANAMHLSLDPRRIRAYYLLAQARLEDESTRTDITLGRPCLLQCYIYYCIFMAVHTLCERQQAPPSAFWEAITEYYSTTPHTHDPVHLASLSLSASSHWAVSAGASLSNSVALGAVEVPPTRR